MIDEVMEVIGKMALALSKASDYIITRIVMHNGPYTSSCLFKH